MRDHLVSMKNSFNKDYYGQFGSFNFSTVENLQAASGRSRPEESSGKLQEFRSYRIWGGLGKDSPGEMLVISEVSMRRLTLPMRTEQVRRDALLTVGKPSRLALWGYAPVEEGKAGRLTYCHRQPGVVCLLKRVRRDALLTDHHL